MEGQEIEHCTQREEYELDFWILNTKEKCTVWNWQLQIFLKEAFKIEQIIHK